MDNIILALVGGLCVYLMVLVIVALCGPPGAVAALV